MFNHLYYRKQRSYRSRKRITIKDRKRKKRCQKIALDFGETISEEDIYITTRISNTAKADGTDCFSCTVVCYNLQEYRKSTLEELKEELSEAKEELEDLKEELGEIEDLDKDDYDDYGFDSEKEYKKKLEDLNVDIFLIETDIEVIEKIFRRKNL